MVPRWKSSPASVLLIAITTLAFVLTQACRTHPRPGDDEADVEPAGEPDQYSATLVRTVDDGTTQETSITRETRSGEKRREEWMEQGQNRALIWRPDLGKSFLLDLDRRAYVELEITPGHVRESQTGESNPGGATIAQSPPGPDVENSTVQAIDHYLDDTQSPARVQTRMLPAVVIDGHACRVYEQRATFLDGHTETTRRFRANDLGGLALRIEAEMEQGATRVITERRDVRIEVAADAFVVPADFTRMERVR